MKKKLNIFLDIDDVVLHWIGAYTEHFGLEMPNSWDKSETMTNNLKTLSKTKDYWLNIPIKNIPNFIPKGYVSARGIPVSWTKESFKKYKIPGRSNIHQVNWNISKLDKLKMLGADLMIDDKVETFEELNKNGVPCLLMDAYHNKEYNTPYRVYSLDINEIKLVYNKLVNN